MKTILVPTDFSKEANAAIRAAVMLHRKNEAKIIALHVIETPLMAGFSATAEANYESFDDVVKHLEIHADDGFTKLDMKWPKDEIEYRKTVGNMHSEIKDVVEAENIDLIIMGTTGASGMDEAFVGSNAEKVVRHATCPVICLRAESRVEDIKKIVFAASFEEDYINIAKQLKTFQELFGAELHLLRVNTPHGFENSFKTHKLMKDFGEKYGFENYTTHTYNDFFEEDGIVNFAEHNDMDLIAVSTHSRTGIAHLLSGSISEGVVNHSSKPVVTFTLKDK